MSFRRGDRCKQGCCLARTPRAAAPRAAPCEPTRSTFCDCVGKSCAGITCGEQSGGRLRCARAASADPSRACCSVRDAAIAVPPLTLSSLAGLKSTALVAHAAAGVLHTDTALPLKTTVPRGKSKRSTFVHIEGTWAERRIGSETLPTRGAAGGSSTSRFVFFTSHSNLAAILAWYSAVP